MEFSTVIVLFMPQQPGFVLRPVLSRSAARQVRVYGNRCHQRLNLTRALSPSLVSSSPSRPPVTSDTARTAGANGLDINRGKQRKAARARQDQRQRIQYKSVRHSGWQELRRSAKTEEAEPLDQPQKIFLRAAIGLGHSILQVFSCGVE